jgi:hypothetical protein
MPIKVQPRCHRLPATARQRFFSIDAAWSQNLPAVFTALGEHLGRRALASSTMSIECLVAANARSVIRDLLSLDMDGGSTKTPVSKQVDFDMENDK